MGKEKVICDTDVMIDYLDREQSRHTVTVGIINKIGLDNIAISAITKMELIAGVGNKSELRKLKNNINFFDTILVNQEITIAALQLIENYKLSHGIAIPDALIAATSIYTGIELFTYNLKDFKFIDKLKLYPAKIA